MVAGFVRTRTKNQPLAAAGFRLFKTKAHALSFLGAASLANDCFGAAFTLRDGLRKTHLGLLKRHNATLQNLAIEAANEVLIGFVLIFSRYFDCHMVHIIPNFHSLANTFLDFASIGDGGWSQNCQIIV